jgi:hypothetical protein
MNCESKMQTLEAIRHAARSISTEFPRGGDGRLVSAIHEGPYLERLKQALGPQFHFEIAPPRHWYDFKVDGIPINLKITEGGTDNAFNKAALLFTYSGQVPLRTAGNMNQLLSRLKDLQALTIRDPSTEYHYLVIHKRTGNFILKSILDIHTYIPNCAADNKMQINWDNEFSNQNYAAPDRREKLKTLLRVIQEACRKQIDNMRQFAECPIDSLM